MKPRTNDYKTPVTVEGRAYLTARQVVAYWQSRDGKVRQQSQVFQSASSKSAPWRTIVHGTSRLFDLEDVEAYTNSPRFGRPGRL